jgi:polysaccharide chain length determinant protein (PEP-CTERM system associated)
MAEETSGGGGLQSLLAGWRRRKWLAIPVCLGPLTAAVSLIVFLPNVYQSTATILVERQKVPESFVQSTVTGALETRIQTISQEILSRSRLDALIGRFGLYPDLRKTAPPEQVIERMRADIKLELKAVEMKGQREREATVAFTVSYQGRDAATVALVANTLASFYIEENLKAGERQAAGTAEFLSAQLVETKKRLDEQEQRVSAFKRRHLGELPQQMETNLATLDRLYAQLRQNADNQTRAAERRQAMTSQLAEAESLLAVRPAPAALPEAPGAPAEPLAVLPGPAETRLARARQDLARLRTQFGEKYPDVVQLAAEVAVLERDAAEEKARVPRPEARPEARPAQTVAAPPQPAPQALLLTPYVLRLKEALAETEADLKVLKGEDRRLRGTIAEYQARVENVPRREQEFRELSRDYESTNALYQSLRKRYEEAQLAESMEQRQKGEQFRVLDPAVPSHTPAAPKRLQLLLVALLGSVGLGVGAAMLAEHLDTSFHTLDDLRAFSRVPVLVSIPRIVTATDRRWRRVRQSLAATAGVVALAAIAGGAYFIAHGNEQIVTLLLGRGGA